MNPPTATTWTALAGGSISGTSALAAGWLSERVTLVGWPQRLLEWSFLLLGFLTPFVVLVVGLDYLKIGARSRSFGEASRAFAEAGRRVLIWFGVAGSILMIRGLAPLWLR
jgi:hypothetical protein